MEKSNREFIWTDLEYPHKNRTTDWYWGLGISAIIIAGISIYLDNTLFAILVIVGALVLGLFSIREPREITYKIDDRSIVIGNDTHYYSDLESFYISERGQDIKLIIASKHAFTPYIIVSVFDHDPDVLRAFLIRKLKEVHHEEPLLYFIAEKIGL